MPQIIQPKSDARTLRAEILARLNTPGAIRPLSQTALKLMSILRTPDSNVLDIVGLIESDPGLAMRSVALANSPLYGHSREINSVRQAVVIIGRSSLSQMTATFATQQLFCDEDQTGGPNEDLSTQLFKHSLACGAVVRSLMEHCHDIDEDEAYLAAILHDIGKLVLSQSYPNEYHSLLLQSENTSIPNLEVSVFGITHQEIGGLCCQSWGLPEAIVTSVQNHHHPTEYRANQSIVQVVGVANELTHLWHLEDEGLPAAPVDTEALDQLGLALPQPVTAAELQTCHLAARQIFDELVSVCGVN